MRRWIVLPPFARRDARFYRERFARLDIFIKFRQSYRNFLDSLFYSVFFRNEFFSFQDLFDATSALRIFCLLPEKNRCLFGHGLLRPQWVGRADERDEQKQNQSFHGFYLLSSSWAFWSRATMKPHPTPNPASKIFKSTVVAGWPSKIVTPAFGTTPKIINKPTSVVLQLIRIFKTSLSICLRASPIKNLCSQLIIVSQPSHSSPLLIRRRTPGNHLW